MYEMIDNNRFAYFLNAVHYCIWLNDIKFGEFNERIAHYLLDPIPNFLFTKEWRERYYERLANSKKDREKFLYNKKKDFISSGPIIGLAIFILVIRDSCLF